MATPSPTTAKPATPTGSTTKLPKRPSPTNYRAPNVNLEDPELPEHIRAAKIDYQQTGFDRGHLCPAADCPSQRALENSFFLSNIAPQVPAFNRGYWKMVEQHVRELASQFKTIHIFSGPLYLSSKGRDGRNYVKYEVIGPQTSPSQPTFSCCSSSNLPPASCSQKAISCPTNRSMPKSRSRNSQYRSKRSNVLLGSYLRRLQERLL